MLMKSLLFATLLFHLLRLLSSEGFLALFLLPLFAAEDFLPAVKFRLLATMLFVAFLVLVESKSVEFNLPAHLGFAIRVYVVLDLLNPFKLRVIMSIMATIHVTIHETH